MNITPSPLGYNYDDVLGNPVLCTALFTLQCSPTPPWLRCDKTSVGQVHHYSGG